MATSSKLLTESSWTLISSLAFIGQTRSSDIIVTNSDSVPSGDVSFHEVTDNDNLAYPRPSSGSWYAKVKNGKGNAILVITDVG